MSADARFAAGDWYAVVGEHVTVLLPSGHRDRVAGLWELADSGASADALLDALLERGLSSLDHFALVARGDDTTRVIVRGTPTATLSAAAGEEVVTAAVGTAWAERLLPDVTSVRVALSGDDEVQHPLTPGLARVSAVEIGTPPAPSDRSDAPEPVMAAEPVPDVAPEPESDPVVAAEPAPDVAPEPSPVPDPPVSPVPPAAPELDPVPAAQPLTFGEPADDPSSTGETPAVPDDWADRDGQTRSGHQVPDFDRPPIPGQEVAPEVVSRPVASLVFSTGDVVAVDRTVLIGRAPEARRFASHDQPHVVTVASPHQEISSTHLEIRPGAGADHGSAIATDLGSTNGTVLALPGLDPEDLKPGIAVSLVPGAVLDLGDGVTIQVTNP